MSPDAITHHASLFPTKARRLRMIRGWMHEERIGAPAVLSLAWALTVLTAGLLAWGGITHGWSRAVLLLMAAGALRARRGLARLGATMPMNDEDKVPHVGDKQRWGERAQQAIILLAAGLCAYGSGFLWSGPALGVLAAGLILAGGSIARRQSDLMHPPKPDPAMLMALFIAIAAAEPAWGWRGQLVMLGLSAVCAVLAWRLYRRLRPTSAQA